MPNIPVYESKAAERGLQPSNLGVEAFEMEGRRVGSFYHQIGESLDSGMKTLGAAVEQHQTQSYVLAAGRHLAEMQANHQAAWDTFIKKADLSDHTQVDAFRQGMEKDYGDFIATAPNDKAKMWATEQINEQRRSMYARTAADASTMAGAEGMVNHAIMLSTEKSNVYNDLDQLGVSLKRIGAVNETILSNPNISPEHAAQLRAEEFNDAAALTYNALRGAIARDPVAGEKLIESLPQAQQYLGGTQLAELHSYAEEQHRAQLHDAAWQQEQDLKNARLAWDQKWTDLQLEGYGPDGVWRAPKDYNKRLAALGGMPGADPEKITMGMNRGEEALRAQINGTYTQDNQNVRDSFFSRLALPPGDPNALTATEIEQAVGRGDLSDHTAGQLREGVQRSHNDPSYNENWGQLNRVIDGFKTSFTKTNPLSGVVTPVGDVAYGKFQQAVWNAWQAEIRAGKKPGEAEQDLTNPSSPNYIGRLVDRMKPTEADLQRGLDAYTGKGSTAPTSKKTKDLAAKLVP